MQVSIDDNHALFEYLESHSILYMLDFYQNSQMYDVFHMCNLFIVMKKLCILLLCMLGYKVTFPTKYKFLKTRSQV